MSAASDFKVGDVLHKEYWPESDTVTVVHVTKQGILATQSWNGTEFFYKGGLGADFVKVEVEPPKQAWTITTEYRPAQHGERYINVTRISHPGDRAGMWIWDGKQSSCKTHVVIGMAVRQ